jgi:hypothetical protein
MDVIFSRPRELRDREGKKSENLLAIRGVQLTTRTEHSQNFSEQSLEKAKDNNVLFGIF